MVLEAMDTRMSPAWEQYCSDPNLAGPFENRILYAMCRDHPDHKDPYVTAGKVTAIGRIYAAAPERGAGKGRATESLVQAIGNRLSDMLLDQKLLEIEFAECFSSDMSVKVVEAHQLLVTEIAAATREWSSKGRVADWSPRNQASFASKYLHFHRPNAFPIMDSFAKSGLVCTGINGPFNTYAQFCGGISQHIADLDCWTPRGIDTALVAKGRAHSDRSGSSCRQCNITFLKRPRTNI